MNFAQCEPTIENYNKNNFVVKTIFFNIMARHLKDINTNYEYICKNKF